MAKALKNTKRAAKKPASDKGEGETKVASGKKLVVVESPAKAKTINKYLGRDYVVRASMGHVRDLPAKEIGVDLEHGFTPTYEPLAGRKKVLNELKKYARTASEVYLATDLDREGEAIAWHLAESLKIDPENARRVIFNEITKKAIQEAFLHPHALDMNKVNAQQARRILDRIVGYKVSPLLWRKVATGLSAGRVQSVAVRLIVEREREIDAFLPEEYWRIGAIFSPDAATAAAMAPQWRTFLAQLDERGNPPTQASQQEFLGQRGAFRAELAKWKGEKFEPDNAQAALEAARAVGLADLREQRTEEPAAKGPAKNRLRITGVVAKDAPAFVLNDIGQRESRSRPYAPFTTAALQQSSSVVLHYSASRTMRIAQQLYEGVELGEEGSVGLITYMRTDSTNLSAEALGQVRELIERDFGPQYLPEKPNVYAAGERAQQAHEAIRPTDVSRRPADVKQYLTEEQFKLYQLVWNRFVSCQMPPAVWLVTEADILCQTPAGEAVFKAMGRSLKFDGFLRVAGLPKGGEQMLPRLEKGQGVYPVELDPTQHFTQPPPRYTEASLVKAMEADGIGRPSTYANIIQTIQDRAYVELIDRSFHPTHLGLVVTDKLVKHFPKIFDVQFTAHMEDELDKVEDNKLDWVAVLGEFYGPFEESLQLAAEQMVHAKAETEPSDYTCPACGKPMVYRFSRHGRYLACTGYPECKTTAPVDKDGKRLERIEVDTPCPLCGKKMIVRRSRTGTFLGCSGYPECRGTLPCASDGTPLKLIKEEDLKETCAECGSPMAVRWKFRRAFLGCSSYPTCRNAKALPDGVYIQPPPKPPPKPAGVKCPKCGRDMLIRLSKRGEFLACSGFPKCRNAMSLDKLEDLKAQQAGKDAKADKKA